MDGHTLSVLSYPEVRQRIAALCLTEFGRSRTLLLEPCCDCADAERRLDLIDDLSNVLDRHTLPAVVCDDINPLLDRILPADASLTPSEFLRIFRTLRGIQTLRSAVPDSTPPHHALAGLASSIPSVAGLLKEYERVLHDDGRIRDDASSGLAAIRRTLAGLRHRLRSMAESFVRSVPAEALESREPLLWEGRTVFLLKSSHRRILPGIVHASSASGRSLYFEPADLVEPNNEMAALLADEEHEILRILRDLAGRTAAEHDRIRAAMERIAEFDAAYAGLRWSAQVAAVRPVFTETDWEILRARHPLIDACVPVDLRIPPPARVLVISGPNTAGKSAALKTAGLLACLAMTGWPVPASACRLPWFVSIFIDLGDGQSLATGLSTFSAHLHRIRTILREATSSSLVLLDEPGSGTEPEAGAAIAEVVLRELAGRSCHVVATTHFRRLKLLALSDGRFANAAVGADPSTGLPDYNLLYGVPGDSRPLDAMRRTGFDPDFLRKVEESLQGPPEDLSAAVASLTEERRRLEETRLEAERSRKKADQAALEAETARRSYEERERRLRDEFRREAKTFLDGIRRRFESLVRTMVERGRHEDAVPEARGLFHEVEERLADNPPPSPDPVTLTPGTLVLVRDRFEAVLESVKDGKAVVRTDSGRATVPIADCRPLPKSKIPRPAPSRPPPAVTPPGTELVLIGLRRDEAERRLRDFLDAALPSPPPFLRIVHGKGNGVLRTMTREVLEERLKAGEIRRYASAPPESGGDGCTVVEP